MISITKISTYLIYNTNIKQIYRVGQKTAPFHCNNFVYPQSIFCIILASSYKFPIGYTHVYVPKNYEKWLKLESRKSYLNEKRCSFGPPCTS